MAKKTPNQNRLKVSSFTIEDANLEILNTLDRRLKQKGRGAFVTKHELVGILTEEYHELLEAVRNDSDIEPFAQELIDVAVGCVFGLACIRAGAIK